MYRQMITYIFMRLPPIPPTSQQSNDLLGFTLDEHNPIAPTYHVLTILQEDICPFFTIRSMTGVLIVWLLLGCCYEV